MAQVIPAPSPLTLFPPYLQLVDPLLGTAECQRFRDLYREPLRDLGYEYERPGGQNDLHWGTYNNNSSTDSFLRVNLSLSRLGMNKPIQWITGIVR
jgi:hypothetical protein